MSIDYRNSIISGPSAKQLKDSFNGAGRRPPVYFVVQGVDEVFKISVLGLEYVDESFESFKIYGRMVDERFRHLFQLKGTNVRMRYDTRTRKGRVMGDPPPTK